MVNIIDIRVALTDELMELIDSYPWFSLARKELCLRMNAMGIRTQAEVSETMLYMPDRKIIHALVNTFPDSPARAERNMKIAAPDRHVPGGDYFSRSQYEEVRKDSDSIFSSFASKASNLDYKEEEVDSSGIYTETLARIYEEQGYLQEAKDIYSKLILRYPEKSVYFAALKEKIDNK